MRSDVNAILFDEPLTVIDPHMKWVLRSQLKQLHRRFGYTMVYVTHDQTEALTFADKVVVMYEGEIVQIGTPAELFERPKPHLRRLFHRLAGHERHAGRRSRARRATLGSQTIELPGAPQAATGGAIELGIRPEYVRLGRDGMPVTISKVEDIGRHKVVRASLEGREIAAIIGEDESIPAEPKVALRSGRHQHLCRFLARRDGGMTMDKTWNNKAWFMVLPVLLLVAFSAVIPLMTVVNYSVQDTFGNNEFFWAGTDWFERNAGIRPLLGGDGPQPDLLRHHPRHRDPARHLHRAQHAEARAGACRSAWC